MTKAIFSKTAENLSMGCAPEICFPLTKYFFIFGKTKLAAPLINKRVSLRVLIDRTSIELFANNGAAVATLYAVPKPENQQIIFSGENETEINSLEINNLKSVW